LQSAPSIAYGKAWLPSLPTFHVYLQQLLISIAAWTGMVILEGGQFLVLDAMHGYVLPLFHYFIWAAIGWYTWAFLTPFVFAIARRYPITRSNWAERVIVPHALVCVVCACIQAVLDGTAGWLYTFNHEVQSPLFDMITTALEKRGMLSVLAYSIIVAMAAFLHLREEVRLRQLRQAQLEARLASAELEMLRMQIHPHFLFNTLQAAITLVQDEPLAAEDVLLRLSQLLRVSLDQMGTNEIPLSRELEFLDLYLGIQRQRFGDRLTVEIHADPSVLDRQVPPLLLQPLVENAIRHGIGKHKGEDSIQIYARIENGGLALEVWNTNSVVDDSSDRLLLRGVGLRNTKARLEQLYSNGASLILRALSPRGAVVLIFIPAQNNQAKAPGAMAGIAP
jgi:two-component system LytT family sensor kinase